MDIPPAVTPKKGFKKHKVPTYSTYLSPLEKTETLSLSSIYIGGIGFHNDLVLLVAYIIY